MTQYLQPGAYDAYEAAGRKCLPNRVIEAFHPETFNATGYPVHVEDNGELWRYVDVMHETRLEQTVKGVLGGLTLEEFALFERAARFMIDFTQRHFGRPLRCENALLRAMNIYRYIRAMNPKVVMELGPGSGYLGLLLIFDGIGYVAYENTQAFYLLQSLLWKDAAGQRFIELADDPRSVRDLLSLELGGHAVHVPWWKAVDLEPSSLPGQLNVVTANHCLTEMQPNAMRYYLRLASILLRRAQGAFLFEGWGNQINHPRGEIAREFSDIGYVLCHADASVTAYAAIASGEVYMSLPLPVSVPRRLRNLVRRLAGLPLVPYEYSIDDFAGANFLSRTVSATQKDLPGSAVHNYADVVGLLDKLYGSRVSSEEEAFLNLIGQKYL